MTAHFPIRLPAPYRLTVADWLEMEEGQRIVEIIEGDVYMAPSPAIRHQRIARELGVLLHRFLRATLPGAEIFFAPTGVKLSDDTVLEPDLLIVLEHNRDRVMEKYVNGPPDVVIEVLSPGTASRDLGLKRDYYGQAGVPEYWIVDPETETIEVLVLDNGNYRQGGLFRAADALRSRQLSELELPLGELWPR